MQKITLDEVLEKATFPDDSFHHCLLAIERVIPDARDKLKTINPTIDYVLNKSSYTNELVENLNKSLFTNQVSDCKLLKRVNYFNLIHILLLNYHPS